MPITFPQKSYSAAPDDADLAKLRATVAGSPEGGTVFIHVRRDDCDHTFEGWQELEDGRGGEQVCSKCGLGAMAWTLRNAE